VAYGAAVQAAKMAGMGNKKVQHKVLLDVTPLSLGTQILNGEMSVVIPKNTAIPTKMEDGYTTVYDNQTSVLFSVYEGERVKVVDNNWLREFKLSPIPVAPKGVAMMKAYFEIDANGILNVFVVKQTTGVTQKITITNYKGSLLTEKIRRMAEHKKI
jgi:heat shock protein 1/8